MLKEELNNMDSEFNIEHHIFQHLYMLQQEDGHYRQGLPEVIDSGYSLNKEKFFVMKRLGKSFIEIIEKT